MFNGMLTINTTLTGRFEPQAFMSHKDSITAQDDKIASYATKEEFEAKLAAAKADGAFPIVLGVHANNRPFFDPDSKRPLHVDQALADGHIVLVTGYDPVKHTVTYDNQWGNSEDHSDDKPVSIDDMFKATKRVSATEWLERIEQRHSQMTENQYANNIEKLVKNYEMLWNAQKGGDVPGAVDEQDQLAAIAKVNAMLKKISPARADLVRKHLKDFLEHNEDPPAVNNTIAPPSAN